MTEVPGGSAQCSDDGCLEFRYDADAALREGWDVVEGKPYCPLHRQEAARRELKAAEIERMRERIEKIRAERHDAEALTELAQLDYARWDEFQRDLADYHKAHGELAPTVLRLMNCRDWLKNYRKLGRIDVELASESLREADSRASATRNWLMRR